MRKPPADRAGIVRRARLCRWPAWSAWQLRSAVKARDLAAIERRVDWPLLRANLKRTIAANLKDDSKAPEAEFLPRLSAAPSRPRHRYADRAAVRPRTLAHVLAGRLLPSEIKREMPGGDASSPDPSDAEEIANSDPLSPRRLRWAFFGHRRAFASRSPIVGAGQARGQHLRAAGAS